MLAPTAETVIRCVTDAPAKGNPWWSSPLVTALFGLAATALGATLAFVLTRQSQREQWIRDRRNEEFRNVLEALAASFQNELNLQLGVALAPDEQKALSEARVNLMRVVRSCIFTAYEIGRLKIELRWTGAIRRHENTLDVATLAGAHTELQFDIVEAATRRLRRKGD